jgi:hypothetical protein
MQGLILLAGRGLRHVDGGLTRFFLTHGRTPYTNNVQQPSWMSLWAG